MKKLVPHDKFLEFIDVLGASVGSMIANIKQGIDILDGRIGESEATITTLSQKIDPLHDLEARITKLESYHQVDEQDLGEDTQAV